jgi:hypothetical protein
MVHAQSTTAPNVHRETLKRPSAERTMIGQKLGNCIPAENGDLLSLSAKWVSYCWLGQYKKQASADTLLKLNGTSLLTRTEGTYSTAII